MNVFLKISDVAGRLVRESLGRWGLSIYDFRKWRAEFELLLSADPDTTLKRVKAKEGWLFECKQRVRAQDMRDFNIVWEIDRDGGKYHLVEFRVSPLAPEMPSEESAIAERIRQLHGCEARYFGSQPVTETFQGQVVWDGIVDLYDLIDHPTAKRCYVWKHRQDDGSERYMVVLEIPPVCSAITAVQVAIAADAKGEQS